MLSAVLCSATAGPTMGDPYGQALCLPSMNDDNDIRNRNPANFWDIALLGWGDHKGCPYLGEGGMSAFAWRLGRDTLFRTLRNMVEAGGIEPPSA